MSDIPEAYEKCLRCNVKVSAYDYWGLKRISDLLPVICMRCLPSYIQIPVEIFIVRDLYTAKAAYFSTRQLAEDFIKSCEIAPSGDGVGRYCVECHVIDSKKWE